MIKLGKVFTNAFRKARQMRPAVIRISEQEYRVRRSDGSLTPVVFMLHAGGLWAQCGCYAGAGTGRARQPLPCYHVAAALLSGEQAIAAIPAPAIPTARAHSHHCPRCTELWPCRFQGCEALDDLHCDSCEQREIEEMDWSLAMAH